MAYFSAQKRQTRYIPSKRRLTVTRLHAVIYQKIEPSMDSCVRISRKSKWNIFEARWDLCCGRWRRCSHYSKLPWRWGSEICHGWTRRRVRQRCISWLICADISSRGLNSGTKRTWTAFYRMWVATALCMWHYALTPRPILLISFIPPIFPRQEKLYFMTFTYSARIF